MLLLSKLNYRGDWYLLRVEAIQCRFKVDSLCVHLFLCPILNSDSAIRLSFQPQVWNKFSVQIQNKIYRLIDWFIDWKLCRARRWRCLISAWIKSPDGIRLHWGNRAFSNCHLIRPHWPGKVHAIRGPRPTVLWIREWNHEQPVPIPNFSRQ